VLSILLWILSHDFIWWFPVIILDLQEREIALHSLLINWLFSWADGHTWKHPFGHPGYQEWHGCYRACSGSQWPTKYHVNIWQFYSTVPQSRAGKAQLWPKHTDDSKEEPTTEAGFTIKNHYPRTDWCKLYWQMVKDDLPNSFFLLQHNLLALLCQLKRKNGLEWGQEQIAKHVTHFLFVSGLFHIYGIL